MANILAKLYIMSEDSSSSDAYFELFADESEMHSLPQHEKRTCWSKMQNCFNDITDSLQKGSKVAIEEINSLNNHNKLSSYELDSLFNKDFSNDETYQLSRPLQKFTEDKTLNSNITLTKSIPWSILPNKTTESSINKQIQNNEGKQVSLLYATKTEFLLCSIAINHDGSIFAYSDGSSVYFVSLQDGSNLYSVRLPDNREIQTRVLCFSKDSKYLAASICNGKIAVVSDKSTQAVLSKHTNIVSALSFTEKYLISGGFDGTLIIWKINSKINDHFSQMTKSNNYTQGEMSSSSSTSSSGDSSLFTVHKEIQYQSVISIDICQSNSIVAIGFSNSTIGIFDTNSLLGETEKDLENEKDDYSSSSTNHDNDNQIHSTHSLDNLESIISGYSESSLSSPDSSDSTSFDSNNQKDQIPTKLRGNSNSSENSIHTKLDNKKTSKIKSYEVHQKPLLGVTISSKNNAIATCSRDNTAKIWDISKIPNIQESNSTQAIIQNYHPLLRTTLEGHDDFVTSATFSPIDDILFTGSKDEKIKAWDSINGELLFTINAHQNTVFSIKHHPTKRIFVSCSGDGLICVWNYMSNDQ